MLHHNELITIEEETILNVPSSRNGMQRKFTLTNRGSKFSFGILSSGGSIVSIKVNNGTHEVVLPTSLVSYLPLNMANNQIGPSIGPSNRRDLDSYPAYCEWTSHVLGSDTLLLTAPSSQSVIYQLTSSDEFIITGKVKNFHAIAPFYLNLNSPAADISGHFLQVRCLHPAYYEVIACQPPTSGSNYNNCVSHTANSSEDVNSTTSNVSSVTSVEVPLKFDLITGSFITLSDESVSGANEGQNSLNGAAGRNGEQRGASGHSSLIQDAVYTIVPVISSNGNENGGNSGTSLVGGNVSSSNNGEGSLPCDGSSETAVASSSGSASSSSSSSVSGCSNSERPLAPSVRSSSVCTASNSLLPPPPPPVLLLTLSYQGRSIEMSLQSNSSSSNSGQNNGSLGNNLLLTTSNSVHLPFATNGSSSHASSSNSNSNIPTGMVSAVTSGTQYDSVKLRVRIRRDGISFMPVGMNDFKCIYKVKW